MGLFEGYPFVSKEERERRRKAFEERLAPYGVEEQRECSRNLMKELFPDLDSKDSLFAFFDAKDSYTKHNKGEMGRSAALARLKRLKWIDERNAKLFMTYIEMESEIDSLDDYPTAEQIIDRAFPEEEL